jgi:glycosyltransferase involved in cell wall biosynthesis
MDKIKIIFAGRLVKLKNVDLGIKAVGLLSRCLDLKFEIYGDGPEASGLKKLAEKEIPGIVEFHGWVERHILRKAFAASDIFLLLSDSEGFSIAALEAAASGCALILSDIPANRPLLENGSNGFFCEREISDIAGKIKKCIGGLESFKRKSIEKARGFMWAEAADKYVDVFREAITG